MSEPGRPPAPLAKAAKRTKLFRSLVDHEVITKGVYQVVQ